MFTIEQMKTAHAKVKSGADFPAYVREIKGMGLLRYDFMVGNGQTVYHGAEGFQTAALPIYPEKIISQDASADAVRKIITEHQQGKTDFSTFCQQVADAGVERWVVDTETMLCTYYDLSGNQLVAEPIPS